ncbi:MAG: hypothetical protein WA151_00040, partial [Desulfatirhabdiaceae bacterium]
KPVVTTQVFRIQESESRIARMEASGNLLTSSINGGQSIDFWAWEGLRQAINSRHKLMGPPKHQVFKLF